VLTTFGCFTRDKTTCDKTTRDKTTRDKTTRDKTTRAEITRYKNTRDKNTRENINEVHVLLLGEYIFYSTAHFLHNLPIKTIINMW